MSNCIHVRFVENGVTYDYNIPFYQIYNGKNSYLLRIAESSFIGIVWVTEGQGTEFETSSWVIGLVTAEDSLTNGTPENTIWRYLNEGNTIYPIFSEWEHNYGTVLDSIFTDANCVTEEEEIINCYKLAVWKEQCEYAQCVLKYLTQLKFGINNCEALEKLKNKRRVLNILNCYDPRDIINDTTDYNSITYTEIKQLLNYL